MPRDLFAEAGINPNESNPQQRAPRDLFKEAGINPNEKPLDKALDSIPVNLLLGAGDSVSNLMRGTANLIPGVNIPKAKTGSGTAYNIGKFAGDLGGFIGGGELLDAARAGAESAPYIGKLAKALGGDGLSGVSRRALGSGLYGATQNPDDKLAGAAEMGATSAALDAIFGGAAKLLPSNMLRGNISTEELLKNLEAARGTNTPLGDVVGSPNAKQYYENLTAKIPFSGSGQVSENISNQVKSAGKDIYDSLAKGAYKNDLKSAINNALNKSYDEAIGLKRQHYKALDKLANSYGLKIETPNFQSTANDVLEMVKDSPRLMGEMDQGFLNKLKNYSNPYESEKIKSTNVFKGILNDKAREAYMGGKDYEGGIYKSLKDALEGDVNNAFESTGNPEVKQKYREAQTFYKNNIAPYEQPEIEKFIRKGGDTDLILSTFLKNGQNDRANLLSKLMNKLPEEDKGLVPAAYFSSAFKDGELNPLKMKTLYEKLGNKQKEVLLSPEMKQKMDMFSRLTGMNERSLTRMANPMTGQQAIPAIVSKGLAGTGGSIGAVMGGLPGAIMGAMAAPVAVGAASKGFNKYMTSPNVRESMVKSIMEGSPRDKILKEIVKYLRPTLMAGMASKDE